MNQGLTFDDVLLVPGYNHAESRREVDLSVVLGPYTFDIPIVSANMDTITGPRMAQALTPLGALPILHRFCDVVQNVKDYEAAVDGWHIRRVGVSVGAIVNSETERNRIDALYKAGARIFCVDVAHAHSKVAGGTVKYLRSLYKDTFIIVGNVATYAGADYLVSVGADAIKVGIGSGSVCTTRLKAGVGVPQLTAIMECSKARVPIIADGGIRYPGDAAKALAAGATMVMLGGMLAGTEETPGEVIYPEGEQSHPVKVYRGMASREAQEEYFGILSDWRTDEGVSVTTPARGLVREVIQDVCGGIRSAMTYCGATDLEEFRRRAQFIGVTTATSYENQPHHGRTYGSS